MTNKLSGADNQQETLQASFYYTGFCSGEMSCSLLRLSNRKSKSGGIYYTPDLTVSNADLSLLKKINRIIAGGKGIISPVKGGYNLSIRGKAKVKKALSFFDRFPPIVGDLTLSKLALLRKALRVLEARKSYRRSLKEQKQLERIRAKFARMKKTGKPSFNYPQRIFLADSIGYFLAGVLDAEGSVGIKKSGGSQPFVAIALKDRKIVELFKEFLGRGNIHLRPKEKIYHFEIGARKDVLITLRLFTRVYPSKLSKMVERVKVLQRILNDYTPGSPRR